jgi:hypothetical protein
MKIKHALRLAALLSLLVACSDSDDTVSYDVRVTGIELVQKGGDDRVEVGGLPSANGTLVQPRPGRYSIPTP